MVFHESKDVVVIVMLTQTLEAGRERCAQYFPLDLEQASMILTENSIKSFATPEEEAEKVQVEEGTPVEPAIIEQPHSEGTASDEVYDASETITKTYATKEKIETAEAEGSATDQKVIEPLVMESAAQEEESDAFVTDQSGHKKTLQNIGKVTLLESWFDAKSGSQIRKPELTIGSESKIVWHFLFPGWADYSTPKSGDRDALLELIKLSASNQGLVIHV